MGGDTGSFPAPDGAESSAAAEDGAIRRRRAARYFDEIDRAFCKRWGQRWHRRLMGFNRDTFIELIRNLSAAQVAFAIARFVNSSAEDPPAAYRFVQAVHADFAAAQRVAPGTWRPTPTGREHIAHLRELLAQTSTTDTTEDTSHG